MKKILLTSLLTGMSLFASEHSIIADQTQTNDIINSVDKLNFVNGNQKTQVSGQFLITQDLSIINIPMSFRIVDKITVDVNIPIINIRYPKTVLSDTTALGDISVGANYRYGNLLCLCKIKQYLFHL